MSFSILKPLHPLPSTCVLQLVFFDLSGNVKHIYYSASMVSSFSSRLMGYFLAVAAILYVPSLSVSFALPNSLTWIFLFAPF